MAKDKGYVLQQMPGVFVSKIRLVVAVIVVIVLIIIIIILAALLGHEAAKRNTQDPTASEPTSIIYTDVVPTTPGTEAWWHVRLPENVIPDHYDVLLQIDLKKHRFDGKVSILVNVTQSTDLILVHANDMNVTKVAVTTKEGDERVEIKKHFWFKKNQFYVLMMQSSLKTGQYIITMTFEAFLAKDLAGLYNSTYKNKKGDTVTIAATQLQPTDARKAFPCFDEPALKATFTVTLAHDPNKISISNMPIIKRERKGDWQYDYFDKTVRMPTYLLAFVVCDFGSKTVTTTSGINMTFYAPQDQVDQLDYAVDTGKKIFEYFEKHFNIPYPLPKCDMVAIPDFAAGAMENWGLILYRETAMLFKPNVSSESNKQRVASVISHELAHMWFGNLVTMTWWDDLWLNEGFASFVEFLGVDHVHPDWQMTNQFVILDMVRAFSLDGLQSSHPIKVPVNHPDEINEIFDSISYSKGSSIIRMLRYFLGENVFDHGLTRYLKKYAFSNAVTDDLWRELREESCHQGKCVDVKHMMDTWTLQMNYPVLTVNKSGAEYKVTQERFLYDAEANVTSRFNSSFGYKWIVPFTYITQKNMKAASVILDLASESFGDDGSVWVKGNVGQTGLYRVNYEDSNWKELKKQLENKHTIFNISDRAALIDDSFDLARGEILSYTTALDMTRYLRKEDQYVPWRAASSGLSSIASFVPRTSSIYKKLKEYSKYQSEPLYSKLGFKDQGDHIESYLRNIVLNINCGAGKKTCLDEAAQYFTKWMEDPVANAVPANFRSLVYFYGIKSGGEKEWDFAFDQFLNTSVASERRKLLYGLSASPLHWIISRFLGYALDQTKIKSQDTTAVISYVANYNPYGGQQLAWDFVRMNWDLIRRRYGSGFFAFRNLISSVTRSFTNEFRLEEVLAFKEANKDLGSGARAMDQVIERIKARIQWRKKNEVTVEKWLDEFLKNV